MQAWAPFKSGNATIFAIAVDPDAANRPDCIILDAANDANAPMHKRWSHLLSHQRQLPMVSEVRAAAHTELHSARGNAGNMSLPHCWWTCFVHDITLRVWPV